MHIPLCSLLPPFLHARFNTLVLDRPVMVCSSGSGFDGREDAGLGGCEGGDVGVGVCEFGVVGLGEEGGDGAGDLGEGCLGGGCVSFDVGCFLFFSFLFFCFRKREYSFPPKRIVLRQRFFFFLVFLDIP